MSNLSIQRSSLPWRPWLVAVGLVAHSAFAAGPAVQADASDVKARAYRGAPCTGLRGDAHANCLSEASTRLASTRPSRADENPEQLARNALQRCEPLNGADRQDCVARMQGQGTTTGSVAAGGIYRELVTREVGGVPAPEPSAPLAPIGVAK